MRWMLHAHMALEYEKQMHAWCALTGNKQWPDQHRTGTDPLPAEADPHTRHYCIKALEHSDEWHSRQIQDATEQDVGVGLRNLKTIQSQLNTVMQQQQEMLRAIAELKTSTKPLPADIRVSHDDAKPEMAAPSKLSLWTYDK